MTLPESNLAWTEARNAGERAGLAAGWIDTGRAADSPGHAGTSQFCPHPAPQGAPRLPEEVGGWALLGICCVP